MPTTLHRILFASERERDREKERAERVGVTYDSFIVSASYIDMKKAPQVWLLLFGQLLYQ